MSNIQGEDEEDSMGTSLVVQWSGIHLALQGTRVQSLVEELRSHILQGY